MKKFNPEDKDVLTYGECLGPAMQITDRVDAREYLAAYVAYIQRALDEKPRSDDKTAAQIAGVNLGYYAGYYDNETRARVERLFMCAHPIFGSTTHGVPTLDEALVAGKAMAA